jgi:hypothetical protein
MVFYPVIIVLLLLTFAVQEFIPSVPMAQYATLFLPPVFFFAASVAVPFAMMLLLAFMTGFIWDARYLPIFGAGPVSGADGLVNDALANPGLIAASGGLGFGISIVIFGLLGTLMQGIRPLFKRGRLELPVLMVGFATFTWLLAEYALMTFFRGSFHFPSGMWSKIVTDTLLAMLASPLLFLLLYLLANVAHYEIKYEGLRYNFDGR